jgi:hypothetical protein
MADKAHNNNAEVRRKSPLATAFGGLSKRERAMILALVILGTCCALYFLLFRPGLDRLTALEDEVSKAEETQLEYSTVIAQDSGASEQIAKAGALHEGARGKLFTRMTDEALDSTVTGYLVEAGFDPQTLTLSTMEPGALTSFVPEPLAAASGGEGAEDPAPPADSGAGTEGVDDVPLSDGPDDSGGMDEGSGADGSSGVTASDSIYSYSVNVTAEGGWKNLYGLLGRIVQVDGAEITNYSYTENANSPGGEKGMFSLTIKLYVYLGDDAPTAPAGTEAVVDKLSE